MEWDVAVIGAGPAGATAAIAARHADPQARVLLLDAAQFPRDKVCGDGIAPHAPDVETGLGVEIARLVAGTQPITSLLLVSAGGVEATREFARLATSCRARCSTPGSSTQRSQRARSCTTSGCGR